MMRNKLLAWMVAGLFITVLSSVGTLAYLQRKATVHRFHEQHQAIATFAVSNIEMEFRNDDYYALRAFLKTLEAYDVFEGIVIFKGEKTVLVYPDNFDFPRTDSPEVGRITSDDIIYEVRALKGDRPAEAIKVAVGFTLAPLKAESRRILLAFSLGVFLLIPVMGTIAWRLRWYERILRENEEAFLARDRDLERADASLQETKCEVEHILHNLDQGIITINLDGSINEEHSSKAEEFFGIRDFRNATLSAIFALEQSRLDSFLNWLRLLSNPRMQRNWRMVEKLIPVKELRKKDGDDQERLIKLEFRPIVENGHIEKLMVLATDITEADRAERELATTREEQEGLKDRVLAFVNNDKMAVDMFMRDVDRYVTKFSQIRTTQALSENVAELYRDVHTIKGNAGTFGFNKLARIAGKVEDQFVRLKGCVTPALFLVWTRGLAAMIAELVEINNFRRRFFFEEDDRMNLSKPGYAELKRRLRNGEVTDPGEIYHMVCNLDSKPLASYCKKYRNMLRDYKRHYQKNIAELRIEHSDIPVRRDVMAAFDPALVHIIRNAADHGIESDDERRESGKSFGIITVSYWQEAGWHCFKVADNGRGMDRKMIVQRAVEKGIILPEKAERMAEEEMIQLIFEPGFSTKTEVTEISGRGIGMEAVKNHLESLGGKVEVKTELNIGTTFILRVRAESPTGISVVDEIREGLGTKPVGV